MESKGRLTRGTQGPVSYSGPCAASQKAAVPPASAAAGLGQAQVPGKECSPETSTKALHLACFSQRLYGRQGNMVSENFWFRPTARGCQPLRLPFLVNGLIMGPSLEPSSLGSQQRYLIKNVLRGDGLSHKAAAEKGHFGEFDVRPHNSAKAGCFGEGRTLEPRHCHLEDVCP